MSSQNIGFIGLGVMGTPMAGHLIKAGHKLAVNTHGAVPDEVAKAGARVCASGREVAQASDIIIIMVPDTPDVGKVRMPVRKMCLSRGITDRLRCRRG